MNCITIIMTKKNRMKKSDRKKNRNSENLGQLEF